MKITNKIRDFRKKKHWTQQRLSDIADVPREHISAYENGKGNPTHVTLQKIADALSVTVSELVGAQPVAEVKISDNDRLILSVVKDSQLSVDELIQAIKLYKFAHTPVEQKPVEVNVNDLDYKNPRTSPPVKREQHQKA